MREVDLVKGIGRRVVIVEIEAAVLDWGKAGDAAFSERGDVLACVRRVPQDESSNGFQNCGDRTSDAVGSDGLPGGFDILRQILA